MRKMFSKEQIKKMINKEIVYGVLSISGEDDDSSSFTNTESLILIRSIEDEMSFNVVRNSVTRPLDYLTINVLDGTAELESGDAVNACSVSIYSLSGEELFLFEL